MEKLCAMMADIEELKVRKEKASAACDIRYDMGLEGGQQRLMQSQKIKSSVSWEQPIEQGNTGQAHSPDDSSII